MNCPKCGSQNLEGSKFCINCGNSLINNEVNIVSNTQSNIVNINPDNNITNDNLDNNYNSIQNNISTELNTNNNAISKNNSKSKTILIVCIIALIVVTLLIGGFIIYKHKTNVILNDELAKYNDSNVLIPIKKDKKYGYINTDGKVVVKPLYKNVYVYSDKYVVVKNSLGTSNNDKEAYQLIDFEGNIKMSSKSESDFIYNNKYKTWYINDTIYDKNLKKITDDNIIINKSTNNNYYSWINKSKTEGGIIRADGKITFTYKFKNLSNPGIYVETSNLEDGELKEMYCIVNNLYKEYAVVNCNTGKIIYDFTNYNIRTVHNNIFDVFDGSISNHVLSFYAESEKIIYKSTDKNSKIAYRKGYLIIYENNDYVYYDVKNNKKLDKPPKVYENLLELSDQDEFEYFTGISESNCDNGKKNLNKDGKELLSCEWSYFRYININLYKYLLTKKKNYIIAIKDMNYYIVDIDKNQIVSNLDASYILDDETPFIIYSEKDTKKDLVYSLISNEKIEISSDSSYEKNTVYLKVTTNGKSKYYNNKLKLIYSE